MIKILANLNLNLEIEFLLSLFPLLLITFSSAIVLSVYYYNISCWFSILQDLIYLPLKYLLIII